MHYPWSVPASHGDWGTIPDGTSAALVAVLCLSVWPMGRQNNHQSELHDIHCLDFIISSFSPESASISSCKDSDTTGGIADFWPQILTVSFNVCFMLLDKKRMHGIAAHTHFIAGQTLRPSCFDATQHKTDWTLWETTAFVSLLYTFPVTEPVSWKMCPYFAWRENMMTVRQS